MDEMEKASAVPQGPDLTNTKVDGEGVPEMLKGKTLQEVFARFGSLEDAVKISEQARQTAELNARTALAVQPRVEETKVEEPKEMTDEELSELHSSNPIAAIRAMSAQAERRAMRNLEQRIGTLAVGSAATAESAARQTYPEEFEMFAGDIQELIKSIPNSQSVMSNPRAWDDLMAVVRGKKGNFERLLDKKMSKNGGPSREKAQESEIANVGFTGAPQTRARLVTNVGELDTVQREIADKLGMTPEDYFKWSRV
jgi:hypothetical protein